jgi:two-component system LytT family response regulator
MNFNFQKGTILSYNLIKLKTMLSVVIIDDEITAIEIMVDMLTYHTSLQIKIFGTASNLTDGIDIIRQTQPDIVFLDINMPGRIGLEIYEEFKMPNFKIIFCTAYQQYAIDAIKKYAFGYLLKPLDIDELDDILHKVDYELIEEQKQLQLEDKINILSSPVTSGENVVLEIENGFILGNTRNIEYCYSNDCKTFVVMHSQKEYHVKKSIKQLFEILPENQFYRTHKSFLVNIYYIRKFVHAMENYVQMESGNKIPVSTRQVTAFKRDIKQKILY